MINVALKLDGYAEIERTFRNAPRRMLTELDTAIRKSTLILQRNIMREAPVAKTSGGGNLRQNIKSGMLGIAKGYVRSDAPYSGFVERGTRPHLIRPRNKSVLAARTGGTRSGGTYQFFGKLVRHPGTKANPYFSRGVTASKRDIGASMKQAIINTLTP